MTTFKNLFFAWIFPMVPKRLLSRAIGIFMRIAWPAPLRGTLNLWFCAFFKIDANEAEFALSQYRSFNDLFTRRLKPGARPIHGDWVHPSDSMLTEAGRIEGGQLIQAKGWNYSLDEFLGAPTGGQFEGGSFYTYYLCPADYHRVHASMSGELVSAVHIPGLLWPVNQWSVNNIRRLFCLNERVVLRFRSEKGQWSMVLVGATNVGKMTIPMDPSIITNRWLWHEPSAREYTPPVPIKVGDEVGIFNLGSTVICVFDKNFAPYYADMTRPCAVRVGERVC